jgi:hypothetical protein
MSLIFINPYAFGVALDPDAAAYITAVEGPSADNQALEDGVKNAINTFVVGCKADGIWSAIKASCILSGARTLSGALVPLVGAAPTNTSFVSGDYDRKLGLLGNGSTKFLNANRNTNADPQNSYHVAFYRTSGNLTGTQVLAGDDGQGNTGANIVLIAGGNLFFRNRNQTAANAGAINPLNFCGHNRSGSANFTTRINGTTATRVIGSQTPRNSGTGIYSAPFGGNYSTSQLAFYSIGESLDLALFDTRITTLINDFATAIP